MWRGDHSPANRSPAETNYCEPLDAALRCGLSRFAWDSRKRSRHSEKSSPCCSLNKPDRQICGPEWLARMCAATLSAGRPLWLFFPCSAKPQSSKVARPSEENARAAPSTGSSGKVISGREPCQASPRRSLRRGPLNAGLFTYCAGSWGQSCTREPSKRSVPKLMSWRFLLWKVHTTGIGRPYPSVYQ